MASKKTVSVANLTALGAERLATILIELAEENAHQAKIDGGDADQQHRRRRTANSGQY
ncbi:hypothetical protein [Methylobacterium sp. WSM2598]|uniref:hypothetical protein n=1 Tax=Methylobacterium sp. WSM2598 TaxID=398261 RepID=UPI00039C36FA|nr:hypothetical protein [Methylobacterium sp. WSM2598]